MSEGHACSVGFWPARTGDPVIRKGSKGIQSWWIPFPKHVARPENPASWLFLFTGFHVCPGNVQQDSLLLSGRPISGTGADLSLPKPADWNPLCLEAACVDHALPCVCILDAALGALPCKGLAGRGLPTGTRGLASPVCRRCWASFLLTKYSLEAVLSTRGKILVRCFKERHRILNASIFTRNRPQLCC